MAIGHNAREAEYFENLVFFNEARSMEERTAHYQRMIACCDSRASKVDADCFEYYSHWYYSAIRALVSHAGFNGDYKKLATALDPPIKIAEARKAVTILIDATIEIADTMRSLGGVSGVALVDPDATTMYVRIRGLEYCEPIPFMQMSQLEFSADSIAPGMHTIHFSTFPPGSSPVEKNVIIEPGKTTRIDTVDLR